MYVGPLCPECYARMPVEYRAAAAGSTLADLEARMSTPLISALRPHLAAMLHAMDAATRAQILEADGLVLQDIGIALSEEAEVIAAEDEGRRTLEAADRAERDEMDACSLLNEEREP